MKGYEIVFIMDPNLGEDGQKEIIDKAKSAYAESGGQISHETGWGRRKLAYPVKKREYGIYHVLYGGGGSVPVQRRCDQVADHRCGGRGAGARRLRKTENRGIPLQANRRSRKIAHGQKEEARVAQVGLR